MRSTKHLLFAIALLLGSAFLVQAQRFTPGRSTVSGTLLFAPDATYAIGASAASRPTRLFLSDPSITPGSGTGITVNSTGQVQQQVYKVTVASTNFIAAATTADVTLATLPAKTVVSAAFADLTQTFACTATCTTSTLSMTCGKTAGGNEYLTSFDADSATGQFGITSATTGTALKPGTPPVTPIGDLPSWSTTTAVKCRLTSGTGNIGTGSATHLSQGSVTFYLTTLRMP
jgi:hypothetical protein